MQRSSRSGRKRRAGAKITGGVDLSVADYVRLDGFDVTNTGSGFGVAVQGYYSTGHGHGVQIANNYIHDVNDHAIYAANVNDLLVENNEIYNNYHDGVIVTGVNKNSTNVIIRGNDIHHNGQDGVHPEGFNFIIENNRIGDQYETDQHQDGIEVYGPNDGLIIRNNLVWDTTQNIYLSAEWSYIRNVQVLGNVVWNQNVGGDGHKGLMLCPSSAGDITNLRVEGNTLGYNAINLITDAYAAKPDYYINGLTLRNNIFYMCTVSISVHNPAVIDNNIHYFPGNWNLISYNGGNYSSLASLRATYPGLMPNSMEIDPLLVDGPARDFHLMPASAAIDAGVAVANLTTDPDGNARPLGSAFDIGAYEKR